jgi:hypothetical protein
MFARYSSSTWGIATAILAGHVMFAATVCGQETEPTNLAADARDPTASVTALSIRYDLVLSFYNLPGADQGTLVVQPVIPWKLGDKPHVARVTAGYVINAPDWGDLAENAAVGNLPPNYMPTEELTGLGDLAAVDFFLYKAPWSGRWGIGPALVIPTASDPALGGGKWSAGPAAVAIYRAGEQQLGVLGQGLFSFAGASDRDDLNMISIQPFGGLGFGDGWSVGMSDIKYNYNLDAKRWSSASLGLRLEKLVQFGELPTRLFFDAEYQFVDDIVAAEWTYRFSVVPLL